jgi:hypothetical protein
MVSRAMTMTATRLTTPNSEASPIARGPPLPDWAHSPCLLNNP